MFKTLIAKIRGQSKTNFVEEPDGAKEAKAVDPLDPIARTPRMFDESGNLHQGFAAQLRSVDEFTVFDGLAGDDTQSKATVGDEAVTIKGAAAMDDGEGSGPFGMKGNMGMGMPDSIGLWYMSQGFFGYQACAIIAQHWLVDKACSMSGEDAARNGWHITSEGGDDLPKAEYDAITKMDKELKIKENVVEFNRFKNIFGIRLAIFTVETDDPLYYEKPFNIDGVRKGAYKGISQVDPYWMTPILNTAGSSDPSKIGFYEPQYWVINGKKYHISHLAIARGPQPADILKPTYIFGGVPLTQRIYERVYAAERTANEAPLLAMSKRTMAIHADVDKILANQCDFENRLSLWIKYRDNHGIKVLGTEEAMEQFDTTMTDFDSIIMNQYQIVAAIARVPSTKLLGTSPKGFNATGEFESKSYHEELESIQEHIMMPMLERHYMLLARSMGLQTALGVVCNPVDSVTTKERADLNKLKSDVAVSYINSGVISPDEERNRLMDDEHSGYDRLKEEVSAEGQPGMSPENLANLQKAGAAETAAEQPTAPGGVPGETDTVDPSASASPAAIQALLPLLLSGVSTGGKAADPAMAALLLLLGKIVSQPDAAPVDAGPSVKPSVSPSTSRSVQRVEDAEIVRQLPLHRMPKIRLNGLNLVVENPRGTLRTGTDIEGREWASEMPDHYGFIKGYEGADGDDVDCFIGPDLRCGEVYVITQNCPETGEFDEYKCMIGYTSPEHAEETYRQAYSDDWDGYGDMQVMPWDEFQDWLDSGSGAHAMDEFKEGDHPRAENGQFGQGTGGAASASKEATAAVKKASKNTPKSAAVTPTNTPSTKGTGKAAKAAKTTEKPAKLKSGGFASLTKLPENREAWPAHVKALNLPPAWQNVHASTDPNAYLLAQGRDAKGRPQSVYSAAWTEAKTAEKFGRVKGMNEEIAQMKDKISSDQKSENAKTRNTADAMSVVVSMGIRPGSDTDTKADTKAYGASNLEARHVKVGEDGSVTLDFTGKKGVALNLPVSDPGVAAMLKERKASAGADGRLFPGVSDKGLLEYSHSLDGGDFKTKDFRTFAGTSHATNTIKGMTAPTNEKEYKKAVREVANGVSQLLGNTPTVALQSYIDPSVFSEWKANLK